MQAKVVSITLMAGWEVKAHLAAVDIKNMQKDSSSGPSRVKKKLSESCRQAMALAYVFPPSSMICV